MPGPMPGPGHEPAEKMMSPFARASTCRSESSRSPSAQSLRGLDAVSFLMADVRDGIGPFLAVFLKGTQHWSSGDIGLVMGVSGLAAALSQIPAGMLVDALRAKRAVIAVSACVVATGCLVIARAPTLPVILVTQTMLALVSAVIGPCLAALSLGVVGHRLLAVRVSRNEGFNHAGNVTAAVLAGTLGQYAGTVWLFWLVCLFAATSALTVMLVRPSDIDHELARGGEVLRTPEGSGRPVPLRALVQRRDLMTFLATVVLFHFGNAAMLPLAGQMIAKAAPGQDIVGLGACMIAAQLVMVAVAASVGRAVRAGVGRRKIFLVALAVLPVRGLLFALTDNPWAVIGIQLLDGVSAGIFGVIATVIASDLMRGTGRFNLAQGATSLAVGIGAGLSNVISGLIVDRFGFAAGFLALSMVAAAAFIVFALFMPETSLEEKPAGGPQEQSPRARRASRSVTGITE
ncbi:MFS transporter [Paraburkholderia caffeinitolerans]